MKDLKMEADKVWSQLDPLQFLQSQEYWDCLIISGDGGRLKTHKFMLGAACPFLKKAILASEISSQFEEKTVIHLPDFASQDITSYLDIIYGKFRHFHEEQNRILSLFDCIKICPQPLLAEIKEENQDLKFPDEDIDHHWTKGETLTSRLRQTRTKRSNMFQASVENDLLKPELSDDDDDYRPIPDHDDPNDDCYRVQKMGKRKRGRPKGSKNVSRSKKSKYLSNEEHEEGEDSPVNMDNSNKVSCTECGKKVLKHCLQSHMNNKHFKKSGCYECFDCDLKFHLQNHFNKHLSTFHPDEGEGRNCKHCEKCFASHKIDKLELHEFQCMPLPPPPRAGKYKNRRRQAPITNIEVKLNEQNPNLCPYEGCKYTNPRTSRVKSHYISRHCRQKCPYCGNILAVTSLEQHIIMQHTKQYSFVCHICSKGFVKQSLLTHHIDEEHIKELKHICDDCGKGFFSKLKLNTHKYWAHKNNDWRCEPCNKKYTCQGALIKHLKRHHNGEGIDKLYKNEKGEYKQVRNYKHVTDNSLMIETVDNPVVLDNNFVVEPQPTQVDIPDQGQQIMESVLS